MSSHHRPAVTAKKSEKTCGKAVDDGVALAIFLTPPSAGPDVVGVVLVHLGLQIGTQFCPHLRQGCSGQAADRGEEMGREVEFFCGLNVQKRWFFDIYIQGSKKIQLFRAESEIKTIIAR